MESINPRMPGRPGATWACRKLAASAELSLTHRILTLFLLVRWDGRLDRNRSAASSARWTEDCIGNEFFLPGITSDVQGSRWIRITRGCSLPGCGSWKCTRMLNLAEVRVAEYTSR